MQTKAFYDLQHAKSYLQSSIIRYRNKPVYISNISQGQDYDSFLLTYLDLKDIYDGENPKLGNFPDDAFDLNPVPLGMLNCKHGGVYYISRMPIRQWKIGLTSQNSTVRTVIEGRGYRGPDRSILYSAEMSKTIQNQYPKIPDILSAVHPSAAFSRRFAIKENTLQYRTRGQVGQIIRGEPRLSEKFFFLKEMLMEDLNG